MGMWFGIEVILHRYEGDARGISLHESCPVVHISEILPKYVTTTTLSSNYYLELSQDTYRKDFNKNIESAKDNIDVYKKMNVMRRLRLLWDEGGDDVEYSLKFNSSRAGFWISSGVYNGKLFYFSSKKLSKNGISADTILVLFDKNLINRQYKIRIDFL